MATKDINQALASLDTLLSDVNQAIKQVTELFGIVSAYQITESGTGVEIDITQDDNPLRFDAIAKTKEVRSRLELLKKKFANQFPDEFDKLRAPDLERFQCFPSIRLWGSPELTTRLSSVNKALKDRKDNILEKKKQIQATIKKPSDTGLLGSAFRDIGSEFFDRYLDKSTTEESIKNRFQQEVAENNSRVVSLYNKLGNYSVAFCRKNAELVAQGKPPVKSLPSGDVTIDTLASVINLAFLPAKGAEVAFNSAAKWLRKQQYPKGLPDCKPEKSSFESVCPEEFAKAKNVERARINELQKEERQNRATRRKDVLKTGNQDAIAFESVIQQILRSGARLGSISVKNGPVDQSRIVSDTIRKSAERLRLDFSSAYNEESLSKATRMASSYNARLLGLVQIATDKPDEYRALIIRDGAQMLSVG